MSNNAAPTTLLAYNHNWKLICKWCEEAAREPLPMSEDTCELYISWAFDQKYAVSSVTQQFASIMWKHNMAGIELPRMKGARQLIENAKRKKGRDEGRGKAAMLPSMLRDIELFLMRDDDPANIRNRAMFSFQFHAGLRASDVVYLNLSDVTFGRDKKTKEELLNVHLGHSKNDQQSEGRDFSVHGVLGEDHLIVCPVHTLRLWLKLRGSWAGPLFSAILPRSRAVLHRRLLAQQPQQALRELFKRMNIEGSEIYGTHSLRSGMVTAAAHAGADVLSIQHRTGHKRLDTLAKYVRAVQGLNSNPLANVSYR
jgi:site-specific recombinase XerD